VTIPPAGPVGSPPPPPSSTPPAAHTAAHVGDTATGEDPNKAKAFFSRFGFGIWLLVVVIAEFIALGATVNMGGYLYNDHLYRVVVITNVLLMAYPFFLTLKKRQNAAWHRLTRMGVIVLAVLFTTFPMFQLILWSGDGAGTNGYASAMWKVPVVNVIFLALSVLVPAAVAFWLTRYTQDDPQLEADTDALPGLKKNKDDAVAAHAAALSKHTSREETHSTRKEEQAAAEAKSKTALKELGDAQKAYDEFKPVRELKKAEDKLTKLKADREAKADEISRQRTLVQEAAKGPELKEREEKLAELRDQLKELQETETPKLKAAIKAHKAAIKADPEKRKEKLKAAQATSEKKSKKATKAQKRFTKAAEKLDDKKDDLATAATHETNMTDAYNEAVARIEKSHKGFNAAWHDFLVLPVVSLGLLLLAYGPFIQVWYGLVLTTVGF